MVSKRKISYQWKLFLPLILTMWLVIGAVWLWQSYSIRKDKKERLNEQLSLINACVINALDRSPEVVDPLINFVYTYYRKDELDENLRVSIYEGDRLLKSYNMPVYLSDEEKARINGLTNTPGVETEPLNADDYFYYRCSITDDGRYTVYSVLPYTGKLNDALAPERIFSIILLVVGVVLTFIAIAFARMLGRNLHILKQVAEKMVTSHDYVPDTDFPGDEFGDINRQIVYLYNSRSFEQQRRQKEHEVALHAIEDKARMKRQLTSNINHELRTPLGVIKGYLDTIAENPDMEPEIRDRFIHKAQDHANRMVALLSNVSAITRLEDGGELIATEELNFHDLVFAFTNDIEESSLIKPMQFSFEIPMDCHVVGNFNLLNGALMNLARNASIHSRGTLCELICTKSDENFYYFVFRDNGRGVPEESLPHLFERFYRVDSGRARKAGGTGLGLPIVQSTIQSHGGTITAQNRPEGGLALYFTLVRAKAKKNTIK